MFIQVRVMNSDIRLINTNSILTIRPCEKITILTLSDHSVMTVEHSYENFYKMLKKVGIIIHDVS